MSPRDPLQIQLDFPELTADLIDQLNLRGTLGLLDFKDSVQPIYIVAARPGLSLASFVLPHFESSQVFQAVVADPPGSTVIVDTGPLPAGIYDCIMTLSLDGVVAGDGVYGMEHRNAANTATLARPLLLPADSTALNYCREHLDLFAYEIGTDERIRAISPSGLAAAVLSAVIMMAIRPTP